MRARLMVLMVAGLGATAGCDAFSFEEDVYDDRIEESLDRVERIQDAGFTDPSTLPVTGSAQYNGTAVIEVEDTDAYTLAGDLELNVGFAGDGSVSGTIEDLTNEDDEEFGGAITMSGGTIDRNAAGTAELDPTFILGLGGSIEAPDGTEYQVDESSVALGDFYGADEEFVFGGLAGELCAGTSDCVEFGGTFDGEQ